MLTYVNIAFTIVNMKRKAARKTNTEKRKMIPLEPWIENAVSMEAKKHHRSWSREAVAILEDIFKDRRPA